MLSTLAQIYLITIGSLTSCAILFRRRGWALGFLVMLGLGGGYLNAADFIIVNTLGILFEIPLWVAKRCAKGKDSGIYMGVQLALVALFFAHVIPGFAQQVWAAPIVMKEGCIPFNPLYNIDQVMAITVVLRSIDDPWLRLPPSWGHVLARTWLPTVGLVALMIGPAYAAGFVRFDPQVPAWWAPWLVHNVFLVVVPEEFFFRGLVPRVLSSVTWPRRLGPYEVTALSSLLFGLGHAGGGPVLIVLGILAGGFYTLASQRAQNVAGGIMAHFFLNTVHFFFFSYPSLR